MTPAGRHLYARVALIEARIRALVEHRRQDDPAPDDPFRGLYLTDDDVERLLATARRRDPDPDPAALAEVERAADRDEQAGDPSRLRSLQRRGGLTDLDLQILLAAVCPDLDPRFERLYGYLNDDVTRRRATIGLVLDIAGLPPALAGARARFAPNAPLLALGLLAVEDPDRPFLSRGLRVPDRVTGYLLGDDAPDADLLEVISAPVGAPAPGEPGGPVAEGRTGELTRLLSGGVRLVHLRDGPCPVGVATATAALAGAGFGCLALDLHRLAARPDAEELVRVAGREALLCRAGLVAEPVEALAEAAPGAVRRLTELPVPVLLVGRAGWDPAWSAAVPLQTTAPELTVAERDRLWRDALSGAGRRPEQGPHARLSTPVHLHLGPGQIRRAVRSAQLVAGLAGAELDGAALTAGARAQNAAGLERLAHRIEPAVSWDDLVLPAPVTAALHGLAARARHRDQVLSEWRMRPGGGRGRGVTALFAGDSGTGKTMSAEVIAAELGLDLYRVELASVVDKYVGETEKNLERIFSEAAGVNAVLLFDEADAVFGKRSEVHDAHDRYANVESAYLLQRMETFDGLAVLSTNLRGNIDDGFTRRLDAIIDFPNPTEELRLDLWRRCLAPPLPVAGDLDLRFCARAFELTGGNIRSAAISAAYLAATSGRPVGMAHLIAAVEQEYRKLGRLVLEQEFGDYLALVR